MFKLIIFDFDGPILASLKRSKKSVLRARKKIIQERGISPKKVRLTKETFIKYWGYPGLKTSELMFPALDKKEASMIVDYWRKDDLKRKIPLVRGALKTLKNLRKKGFHLALLTARFHNLKFHFKNYPLESLFDIVQSWKPSVNHSGFEKKLEKLHSNHIFYNQYKPNPGVLNPILKWGAKRGIFKKETVMIDDALVGLKTARVAKIAFLGVCTGPLYSKKIWKKYGNLDKKYIINSIAELPEWLEQYSRV